MENISEEDAAYISAIFDACFRSFQNGSFENGLENITRIEHSVQVHTISIWVFCQNFEIFGILQVQPTKLRSNPLYYRLYYVHLNTIFASLIPLISLLFLNIATVRALRKMVKVSNN